MGYLHSYTTFIAVTLGLLVVVCQGGNLQLLIKTINRCKGSQYSGLPVGFEKLTYSMAPDSGNIMLNGFVVARQDLDNVYVLLDISRCLSDDMNSCQHFLTMNYTELCREFHQKDVIWTTFVDNMKDLPETCPLLAGRYEMVQAYLDLKKLQDTFKLPAGNWMGLIKFYQQTELLTCYYIIATVKPERKRKTFI